MRKEPTVRDNCGTTRGYQKHYREKESPCEPCIKAQSIYTKKRMENPDNRKKKAEQSYKRRQANIEDYKRREKISQEKNREKRLATGRIYHANNREEINRKIKEYRKANPELIKVQSAAEYQRNKEKKKAYRLANKEKNSAWKAEYYQRNQEKIKQYREDNKERTAAWRKATPELSRQNVYKRRARKLAVATERYTTQQILDLYGTDCYLCHEPIDLGAPRATRHKGYERGLHLDHVIPLARGGSDLMENVRPSHAICNLSKNVSTPEAFMVQS